jgi:hypothetical protein
MKDNNELNLFDIALIAEARRKELGLSENQDLRLIQMPINLDTPKQIKKSGKSIFWKTSKEWLEIISWIFIIADGLKNFLKIFYTLII